MLTFFRLAIVCISRGMSKFSLEGRDKRLSKKISSNQKISRYNYFKALGYRCGIFLQKSRTHFQFNFTLIWPHFFSMRINGNNLNRVLFTRLAVAGARRPIPRLAGLGQCYGKQTKHKRHH